MSELTAKQKAFIEALPKNQWNGAAIAAGYSEKSAGVMAHRLLKNPQIAEELERCTAEIVQKTDVEVGEIIVALREIAFGGRATNSERLRALDLLGRYKAMFTDKLLAERTEQQRELSVIQTKRSIARQEAKRARSNAVRNKMVAKLLSENIEARRILWR